MTPLKVGCAEDHLDILDLLQRRIAHELDLGCMITFSDARSLVDWLGVAG